MRIDGRTALVTGAAGGLGAASAALLVEKGARVVALDLDGERLRETASRIGAHPIEVDVADEASVADAIAGACDHLGAAPRIVVHCAGIAGGARTVGRDGSVATDLFRRIVGVNLMGTYYVLAHAAAAMAEADPLTDMDEEGERGVFVATASVAYEDGQVGQTAYAASKGGVASLLLPAARDLAPLGVRVVAIAPGLFETPMMAGLPDEVRDGLVKVTQHPKRLGRAEDFAHLAVAIAENPMLNATTIRLDGAVRLPPK